MTTTMNLMLDVYFTKKSARDQFINLINVDTDWQFTVHGETDIPNSQYVKLYNLNRVDLIELGAILFQIDVDDQTSIVKDIPLNTPKRIDTK